MLIKKVKNLAKLGVLHILDNGGAVKQVQYLQSARLPYRMKKGSEVHDHGIFWTMQFFSNVGTMTSVRKLMEYDNDILKQSLVKLGTTLRQISGKDDSPFPSPV